MAHFVHFISLTVELERAFKNALHSVSACSISTVLSNEGAKLFLTPLIVTVDSLQT